MKSRMKALLREPLVHFLLLGGLLFLFFEWRGSGGPTSSRIVITPGLVEHLASGFGRTWQRPPTDAELKGLIDDYVKEEIATREAVGMGLDRDDTIIRRRLRQKLEFLVEDAVLLVAAHGRGARGVAPEAPAVVPRRAPAGLPAGLREPGAPGRLGREGRREAARPAPREGQGRHDRRPGRRVDAALGAAARAPARGRALVRGRLRAGADEDRAGPVDRAPWSPPTACTSCSSRSASPAPLRSLPRSGRWSSARSSRSGERGTSTPSTSGCSRSTRSRSRSRKRRRQQAAAAGAGGAR